MQGYNVSTYLQSDKDTLSLWTFCILLRKLVTENLCHKGKMGKKNGGGDEKENEEIN